MPKLMTNNHHKKVKNINTISNNSDTKNNAYSPELQEEKATNDETVTAVLNPYIMTVGDTIVRLSFSDNGRLSTQLANAFSAMLK